jgi:hypothetical protein
MGLILLEITFENLVWDFNIKDAGKKWKNMENMIIDRVIEYLVKLKWRLVSAWISDILYSLDSSVFALLKSIKNSGPVEIRRKIRYTLKQKGITINVDGLVLWLGSFYNESLRYCHMYSFVEGNLLY